MRLQYLYSYTQTGHVSAQRLTVTPATLGAGTPLVAEASYGWDNEGRMTSLQEPANGPLDTYTYDVMGRLATGGATYGPAGELLTFNGVNRTYNNLGQLTRMTRSGVMDMEYRYTSGQNNGRIAQAMDYVTGEEVTYTYDALNRLSRAETTASSWGSAYGYDGWGNLLAKTPTKGSAPPLNVTYDPTLNMPWGSPPPTASRDSLHYDVDGRSLDGTAELSTLTGSVSYDPSGKKVVWERPPTSADPSPMKCEVYFYSITGQRLARYQCGIDEWIDADEITHRDFWARLYDRTQHIGGQLTSWNGEEATTDRLGSVRAKGSERYTYYPYGETHTATGSNALYAGLESPLRKYDSNLGRFDRPDPLGLAGVKLGDPGSWNRFAYVGGDPVNYHDPRGLAKCSVTGNKTEYSNPDDAETPYSYAEIQCQSEGGLRVTWSGWVPQPGGPNDNRQLEADYAAAYGPALDAFEQNWTLSNAVSTAKQALAQKPCRELFSANSIPRAFSIISWLVTLCTASSRGRPWGRTGLLRRCGGPSRVRGLHQVGRRTLSSTPAAAGVGSISVGRGLGTGDITAAMS